MKNLVNLAGNYHEKIQPSKVFREFSDLQQIRLSLSLSLSLSLVFPSFASRIQVRSTLYYYSMRLRKIRSQALTCFMVVERRANKSLPALPAERRSDAVLPESSFVVALPRPPRLYFSADRLRPPPPWCRIVSFPLHADVPQCLQERCE